MPESLNINKSRRDHARRDFCFCTYADNVQHLSTITNADKIVVIHNGKIIEQGTHAELLANQGMYYELYRTGFQE